MGMNGTRDMNGIYNPPLGVHQNGGSPMDIEGFHEQQSTQIEPLNHELFNTPADDEVSNSELSEALQYLLEEDDDALLSIPSLMENSPSPSMGNSPSPTLPMPRKDAREQNHASSVLSSLPSSGLQMEGLQMDAPSLPSCSRSAPLAPPLTPKVVPISKGLGLEEDSAVLAFFRFMNTLVESCASGNVTATAVLLTAQRLYTGLRSIERAEETVCGLMALLGVNGEVPTHPVKEIERNARHVLEKVVEEMEGSWVVVTGEQKKKITATIAEGRALSPGDAFLWKKMSHRIACIAVRSSKEWSGERRRCICYLPHNADPPHQSHSITLRSLSELGGALHFLYAPESIPQSTPLQMTSQTDPQIALPELPEVPQAVEERVEKEGMTEEEKEAIRLRDKIMLRSVVVPVGLDDEGLLDVPVKSPAVGLAGRKRGRLSKEEARERDRLAEIARLQHKDLQSRVEREAIEGYAMSGNIRLLPHSQELLDTAAAERAAKMASKRPREEDAIGLAPAGMQNYEETSLRYNSASVATLKKRPRLVGRQKKVVKKEEAPLQLVVPSERPSVLPGEQRPVGTPPMKFSEKANRRTVVLSNGATVVNWAWKDTRIRGSPRRPPPGLDLLPAQPPNGSFEELESLWEMCKGKKIPWERRYSDD